MKKRELTAAIAFVAAVTAVCIRVMRYASDALGREKENRDEKPRGNFRT
jgi:hypothetical protein